MNDYLTYFEANAQFLCHFAFPLFKFWIIRVSVQGFKQETELHFFEILQCCFWDWDIRKLHYSCYERGRAKEHLNLFDTTCTFPIHLPCPKRNSSLLLLALIHFFDKQFAKNNKILWLKNIFNKRLFLSYNSKWMSKFLYYMYVNKIRNKRIKTDVSNYA